MVRPDAAWRRAQEARADQPPAVPREPLWLGAGAAPIGSVEAVPGRAMQAAGLPLVRVDGIENAGPGWQVIVAGTGHGNVTRSGSGGADAALAQIARWLHGQGFASAWRGELLDVTDADGMPHARIERAAVRPLGIATRAVHLVGHAPGGGCWVQQRALDKATDPGLWDTLMGGLIAAGESETQALARETWEEAGLRIADLQALGPAGHLTVRRPVADGYLIEHIAVWSATVPSGLRPENRDGEVARFERLEPAALVQRLEQGLFTLEAGLILAGAVAPG